MIKSPLRYPGGKSKALKHILPLFPPDVQSVISPFVGGGSVEINLASNGIKVDAYDTFSPLVSFWHHLQWTPEDFARHIYRFYPLTKKMFYELQALHKDEFSESQGALFYVLNRSSFNGTTMSGGCSNPLARFTQSSIDRVRNWQPLKTFNVNIADFKDSLNERKDGFVFADPPYLLKNSNLYGDRGSLHKNFDHKGLFDILSKRDGWILCYNNCPEIRELYSKFKIIEPEWSYGMGKNKDGRGRELLILNY